MPGLAAAWAASFLAERPGSVRSVLLAEDLLLLVTDDASGGLFAPAVQVDAAMGGANLLELTLMGKAGLSGEGDEGKPDRLIVHDPPRPGTQSLTRLWRSSSRTRAKAVRGDQATEQEPAAGTL